MKQEYILANTDREIYDIESAEADLHNQKARLYKLRNQVKSTINLSRSAQGK